MHGNALDSAKRFYDTYFPVTEEKYKVVEIGSFDVNGSIRSCVGSNISDYVGLDFESGPGVDVVLTDPYTFPFQDNTFDILVTSSCFEHSEMFWLTFLEGMRILKPSGLFYYNVPSSWMSYHRYPFDCWRFYPDSARALETWAKRNGLNTMVLESYISKPKIFTEASDAIAVFIKDAQYINRYPQRVIDSFDEFWNGFRFPATEKFPNGWATPTNEFHQGTHP